MGGLFKHARVIVYRAYVVAYRAQARVLSRMCERARPPPRTPTQIPGFLCSPQFISSPNQ